MTWTSRLALGAASAIAAVALTACGNSADTPPGSSTPSQTTSASSTDLTIKTTGDDAFPDGGRTYTLTCDPTGGTLPGAAEVCAKLPGSARDPFAPVPTTRVCADVVSGNGVVTVNGKWAGKTVDATFDQRDSCATARFRRVMAFLGLVGATPSGTTTPAG